MSTITFIAEHVSIEAGPSGSIELTLQADMRVVCEGMDVDDRLHEIEAIEVIDCFGDIKLLNAMSEKHFSHWVEAHGDFYEALNAIGIERIREWLDDYSGGD